MIDPRKSGDLSFLLLLLTSAIWAILGYNEQYIGIVITLLAISALLFIYYLFKLESENIDVYAYFYTVVYALVAILIGAGLGNLSASVRAVVIVEGIFFALTIFFIGLKLSAKIHGIAKLSRLFSKPLLLLVLVVSVFVISYVLAKIAKLEYSISSPIVALLMALIPIVAYFGFYRGKF